jgi:hypothetical protein
MTTIALPKGILKSDLTYEFPRVAKLSEWIEGDGKLLDEPRALTLYYTERFGWIVTTLLIRGGRSVGASDRSYGIAVEDGQLVRVGRGPHVKQEILVYMRVNRMSDLQPFLDLYNEGLEQAHISRDTRSSRAAATSARRGFSF